MYYAQMGPDTTYGMLIPGAMERYVGMSAGDVVKLQVYKYNDFTYRFVARALVS